MARPPSEIKDNVVIQQDIDRIVLDSATTSCGVKTDLNCGGSGAGTRVADILGDDEHGGAGLGGPVPSVRARGGLDASPESQFQANENKQLLKLPSRQDPSILVEERSPYELRTRKSISYK